MLASINNRYQVIEQLGQGGMGVVYLVKDILRQDQAAGPVLPIALKLVRADAIGERGLAQFKYEFAAMAQLRHPNLVEVYDFGTVVSVEGSPENDSLLNQYFFTMEHVAGEDLSGLSQRRTQAQKAPDDYTWLYEIIVQVCRALQYLHTRGFIHHDVKPGHIRITPEGQVKLMDFGLISEAHISVQLKARGTPDYIAPEVITGDSVDHRSDLYSLGITLYEVVSGQLPFRDTSSVNVLRQHIQARPELPEEVVRRLPAGLQALIMKLLAKDPVNRYANADQVILAINQISGLKFPVQTGETRKGYIHGASFVGREFEIAHLQGLLMRAIQGQGRLVLIGGAPGTGKMRLARELKLRAQMQRALTLEGACQAQVRSPYRPWIPIYSHMILHYQAIQSPALQTYGTALARLMPELDALYHLSAPQAPAEPGSPGPVVPAIKTVKEQAELQKEAAQFLLECNQPLVIILEDLQHADAESLELLDRLGKKAFSQRLLLCGVFRDEEITPPHPLNSLLAQARLVSRQNEPARSEAKPAAEKATSDKVVYEMLRLGPLNEEETAAFVRSMLGISEAAETTLPPAFLPRLIAETGGNPSFIQAIMQSLLDEEQLRFDGQHWTLDMSHLTLPASIQEAVQRQLERLDEDSRNLLQWAAVLGQWLEIDVLLEVCGLPTIQAMGLINQAVWQNVLSSREQADRLVYRFSTDAVREALYNMLLPQERAVRHQRMLQALRRLYKEDDIADWLAWHAEQAGDLPQALHYAAQAAEKAALQYAYELAVQHYTHALALLHDHPSLANAVTEYQLLSGREASYDRLGDRHAQAADLLSLQHIAQQMGDIPRQIDVLNRLARLANLLGNAEQGLQASQAAAALARQIGNHGQEAASLTVQGQSYYQLSQFKESITCHEQALSLYVEIGDQRGEAENLRRVSRGLYRVGELEKSQRYVEQALAIYREIGDQHGEAETLTSLGVRAKDLASGRNYHEQALAINKALGDQAGQARSYNNLGIILLNLGLYNRAREYMQQALQIGINQQARSLLVHYYETLGRILFGLEVYEAAEHALQEGLRLAGETSNRQLSMVYYYMLSRVALAQGQAAQALELNQQALDHLPSESTLEQSTILAWRGTTYLALGDEQNARDCTSKAVQIIERLQSSGDYPPQEVYWLHYQVLRAISHAAPGTPLSEEEWNVLQQARQAMLDSIASLSDEGMRRNYLNKVRINHNIVIEWTRQSARRAGAQPEPALLPEAEAATESEASRTEEKLKRVLDISVQMNETHDIEALLNYVMDQVIELSGAERSLLVLVDQAGQMDFRVARGMALDEIERAKAQISYTVLGEAARSRKPILLQDALTDERFGRQSSVLELNLRSVLCVPMLTRSELIGMIYADNRSVSGRFSQADVNLMTILSNQAATAIENAHMYQELQGWTRTLEERVAERTQQLEKANQQMEKANQALSHRALQLEASSQVAQQATSILIMDDLLAQVVQLIQQHFGYYFVSVWLLEDDQRAIRMHAGATRQQARLDEDQVPPITVDANSIIASVCRTGSHRLINDIHQVADYLVIANMPNILSELALPLRMGNRILGALDISTDQLAAFSEEDVMSLQTLTGQVAIAIRNAQLYETEQKRRLLAEALGKAGREITSSLDMSEVPGRILDQLAAVVSYERCSIWLQEGKTLTAIARRGFPEDEGEMIQAIRPGDVYEQVVEQCKPVLISDVTLTTAWRQAENLPINKSWMGVPLVSKNRVIGMVSLTRCEANAFYPADATIASAFADQAAVALENAGLYQQVMSFSGQLEHWVEQRTDELNRAYQVLERLDKTKSDFINVAAHELRTPLTVLMGYAQVARTLPTVKDDTQTAQLLSGIMTGAERLHEIVNSMLDVSKISNQTLNVNKDEVSLSDVVEATTFRFEKALQERRLSIDVQGLRGIPFVQADSDLLNKLFYHLLSNAIKYTPDGGKITIQGRMIDEKSGAIDPPQPDAIEVIVSDTGIGIDPENHKLIFEKFYSTGQVMLHSSGQTKFKGGGPGLGLAIARGIVEAHGGRIWVESPGYDEKTCPGSQFHVVLRL